MIKKYTLLVWLLLPLLCAAQKKGKEISLALTNNHSAYPFASFGKLLSGPFHPGIEVGYGFNWKTGRKHDWWQSFKVGVFHHRFVQTAVPIYTQFGYRLKPFNQVHLHGALGAGYLHSVPATAVLKQSNGGEYEKSKGVGRPQALVNLSFGVRYVMKGKMTPSIFLQYTQQLQTPFIKSYVPLLPYNAVAVGICVPLKK